MQQSQRLKRGNQQHRQGANSPCSSDQAIDLRSDHDSLQNHEDVVMVDEPAEDLPKKKRHFQMT